MLFNSIQFLIFLPLVFICYWLLSYTKHRNFLLLISSYFFYAYWDWRFLGLIILSSCIDYFVGLQLGAEGTAKSKKTFLYISLFSNLGILGLFKYFNFFAASFESMATGLGYVPNDLTLNLILPVGISFYTFQTLSYSIDVYRKNILSCKNPLHFFTYVAFFPQLVAGPIERASNLIPQFEVKRNFNFDDFKAGFFQILIGLFRKIVVADTLAVFVDFAFENYGNSTGSTLMIATVFYGFQIYFDFAGYSDIAIGTARLFGIRFQRNFDLPYFSISITEFWRRWHISLSSWLKDYLYISLGGNRFGKIITYRNLMLTMLLGGLWHGASFNFIIWGGIHGVFLISEKFLKPFFVSKRQSQSGLIKFGGWVITMIGVFTAWVFFRANTLESALSILNKMYSLNIVTPNIDDMLVLANCLFVLGTAMLIELTIKTKNLQLEHLGTQLKNTSLMAYSIILILFTVLFYSTSQNFIYFQF